MTYRTLRIVPILLAALLILSLAPAAPHVLAQTPPAYRPGLVLVRWRTADAPLPDALQAAGLHMRDCLEPLGICRLQVPAGQEAHWQSRLAARADVAFAGLDYRVQAAATPNDPSYAQQWSLPKIGAPAAWDVVNDTQGLVIAVLDSGIDLDHPDLSASLWVNADETPDNGLDDDGNGKIDDRHGWRFYHRFVNNDYVPDEDSQLSDDYGHGSHVAGILAAQANNGQGIAGLAWGSQLMVVKVLDQYGNGWYSDVAAGLVYAVDNGARLVNLSLGGAEPSDVLLAGVEYAQSHGVLLLAAAGNQNKAVLYPAAYDSVLAIASSDASDLRASTSNYGPQIDLSAPGQSIYSTWYRDNYSTLSGTSMATPHVAGAAALLWASHPNASMAQIASALRYSAQDIGSSGYDIFTGYGRLDLPAALAWLERAPVYLPLLLQ